MTGNSLWNCLITSYQIFFVCFFQICSQLDMIRRCHLYNLLLFLFGAQVGVFQIINSRGLSRHGGNRENMSKCLELHVETWNPPKKSKCPIHIRHIINIYEPTVSLFGGSMMALNVFSLATSASFSPRGSHRTRWMAIGWHLFAETKRAGGVGWWKIWNPRRKNKSEYVSLILQSGRLTRSFGDLEA